jgi:hypothetical protein
MRHQHPWFRSSVNAWYVWVGGQQHFLGKHPEGLPKPRKRKRGDPPPNPYRQEIEAVIEAVAEAVRKETGHECVVQPENQNPEKRVIAVMPPPANPDRPFADHTEKRLLELLDRNQYEMTRCKPRSVSFCEALRDIGLIVAELQRRDLPHSNTVNERPRRR